MSSIALPALGIHPPQQQENPVEQYVKLKSLLGQQKLQDQALQEGQIGIQQKQQALKDQQAMTAAMQEWDGKDLETLPSLVMKKGGSAQAVFGIKQKALEQKQAYSKIAADDATTGAKNLESMKVKNDMVLGEINSALQSPDEELPQRVMATAQDLAQKQLLDPQHVQIAQQIVQSGDPQKIRAALGIFAKGYMSQSQQMAQAKDEADLAAKKAQLPGQQAESQAKQLTLAGTNAQGMTAAQQAEAKARQQTLGMEVAKFSETKRHNLATEGQLTPEGLTAAAQQFATTGQMPQVGRSGAVRSQIINEASRLYPNLDIAANSGAYKANQDSLKSLQKNFDQVTAFENTAGKNLDVFLNTAKGVVDSGSPLVNAPLRMVNDRIAGSDKQAAFAAARTTALTEIAKVLNSSNANGVLSDSARHEVEQLVGKDATLKQIYSAATILKQDMENRRQSYQDQIGAIQQRIKAPKSGAQPSTAQSGAKEVHYKIVNGQLVQQ